MALPYLKGSGQGSRKRTRSPRRFHIEGLEKVKRETGVQIFGLVPLRPKSCSRPFNLAVVTAVRYTAIPMSTMRIQSPVGERKVKPTSM